MVSSVSTSSNHSLDFYTFSQAGLAEVRAIISALGDYFKVA
jgi:hypothetical protein